MQAVMHHIAVLAVAAFRHRFLLDIDLIASCHGSDGLVDKPK
jgi:hypothetical protein